MSIEKQGAKRTKVLIVEDESLISYGYRLQLQRAGFDVVDCVRTALAAEQSMSVQKPDLILMDIYIKGDKNGLEFAKEIHEKEPIPILFITASTRPEILEEIKMLQHCELVPKPVNTDLLEEVLWEMKKASN